MAVANPISGEWQFFFGLNVDKPIPISNLPLIGDLLPREDTVQITQIRVVIASAAFDNALATKVNAIISKLGGGYPLVPDTDKQGMPAGLGFSMVVAVGSYDIPIMFGAGQSSGVLPLDAGALLSGSHALILVDPAPDAPVNGAASSDGVLWFNLQKTFGPVSIQKIGVQYKQEKIYVLVNMTLSGAGLSIGLLGFGIGSSISDFEPSFTIQGIDVSYSGGGVEISGGLRGTIDPVNFVGELMVLAEGFGIAGLAGYTSVEGSPSMFLYAVLNSPLGGPACFFVTGIAGGFGFNRDLQVPDVSGVAAFPLVQWAQGSGNPPGMNMTGDIGSQVTGVLDRLSSGGVVAPRVGQYWLAAGVKFTSFEFANSFAPGDRQVRRRVRGQPPRHHDHRDPSGRARDLRRVAVARDFQAVRGVHRHQRPADVAILRAVSAMPSDRRVRLLFLVLGPAGRELHHHDGRLQPAFRAAELLSGGAAASASTGTSRTRWSSRATSISR